LLYLTFLSYFISLFYLFVWYSLILISCAYVQGGVDANDVLPSELNAVIEIDLGSIVDDKMFAYTIDKECKEVGVTYSFQQKLDQKEIIDNTNFLRSFTFICSDIGINLDIKMRPTSSDSRFLREVSLVRAKILYFICSYAQKMINMYYVICIL